MNEDVTDITQPGQHGRRRRRRQSRRRNWRGLLVALGLLAATPVVVVAVLLATLDPNRYRDDIARALSAASGRAVVIEGELGLAPGLAPALTMAGVRLGNAAWASQADMATIGHARAQVRLLPLLARRLEIVRFELSAVTLELERDADGRGNWTFGTSDDGAATGAMPQLVLEDVSLQDIAVTYRAAGAEPLRLALDRAEVHGGLGHPLRYAALAEVGDVPLHLGGRLPDLATLRAGAAVDFEFHASYDALRLAVEGEVADPAALAGIDAHFRLESTTLAQLATLFDRRLPDLQRPHVEGRVVAAEPARLRLEQLDIEIGQTSLEGQLELTLGKGRPRLAGRLDARQVDLEPFAGNAAPAPADAALLPPVPLDWPARVPFDLALAGDIGILRAAATRTLHDVRYEFVLAGPVFTLARLEAGVAGGTLAASGRLDAGATPPRLVARLRLQGMSLTPLVSAAEARNVIGGNLELALDFDGAGATLSAAGAQARGHLQTRIDDLVIRNRGAEIASADLLLGLFEAVNPLARGADEIRVECAVANFPLQDGRLESATGLGIATRRLSILGGRIDLARGALDLGVDIKPREGIGLNVAGLADFVRVGGTLRAPAVTTDAAGLATAGLKTGAAIASGGLTLVAEGLLDRAEGDVDVCGVAAGDVAPPGAGATARASHAAGRALDAAASTLGRAGQALGAGIGKLFGH